jgi:hypothetical protein
MLLILKKCAWPGTERRHMHGMQRSALLEIREFAGWALLLHALSAIPSSRRAQIDQKPPEIIPLAPRPASKPKLT